MLLAVVCMYTMIHFAVVCPIAPLPTLSRCAADLKNRKQLVSGMGYTSIPAPVPRVCFNRWDSALVAVTRCNLHQYQRECKSKNGAANDKRAGETK